MSPQYLARVVVARVDVRPRERNIVEASFDLDVAEEADDGGQLDAEGYCPNFPVVDRDHLHLPLAKQSDSLLPVDNLEGLVRGVRKERLLHGINDFRWQSARLSSYCEDCTSAAIAPIIHIDASHGSRRSSRASMRTNNDGRTGGLLGRVRDDRCRASSVSRCHRRHADRRNAGCA